MLKWHSFYNNSKVLKTYPKAEYVQNWMLNLRNIETDFSKPSASTQEIKDVMDVLEEYIAQRKPLWKNNTQSGNTEQ